MKSLTIGTKFRAGFSTLFAVTLLLGISSVLALRSLNQIIERSAQNTTRKLEITGRINTLRSEMFSSQRGLVLATFMKDHERETEARRSFDTQFAGIKGAMDEVQPLLSTAEGRQLFTTMKADLDKWILLYQELVQLCASGNPAKAQALSFEKILPVYNQLGESVNRWVVLSEGLMAADEKSAGEQYAQNLWIAGGLLALSVLVGVVIFLLVGQINTQLRRMVSELSSGADQVASASGQIATSSQSLSQGASEQASSVEEISASMEEMTAMSRTSGANSAEAMSMMVETATQVERSNAALAEMVSSMSSIKASSERVAKINKTIDEIAFQTNILALNAAVEAARAGEAGKGFAVVADEVRNLAQRAAAAAKDTAALIEESIANSNQGAHKLELVSASILGITEGAQKVKQLVGEVSESGKQQVQGIQQVSTAISQVSTVTQSNASGAEESAAAAEELNAQSMTVRELVDKLRFMVDGDKDRGAGHVPPAGRHTPERLHSRPAALKASAHPEDSFPMETSGSGNFRSF